MTTPGVPVPERAVLAAPYTTYRVGGPMDALYQPTTSAEAGAVLQEACTSGLPVTVLGWGSNVIVASAGIRGVTLITRKLTETRVEPDARRLIAGAGVHLARIATLAEAHGWTGAEFMIGIPATLGGAARMNAGAMGQETARIVHSVSLFDTACAQEACWPCERLAYGYRTSALQAPDSPLRVILSATLQFEPGDPQAIRARMQQNVAFRKAHHPIEPNGGSVFRNPVAADSASPAPSAGRMLDALGAKTWTEGGVRVSPMHANFIVNTGGGTAGDVLRLMVRMKRAIKSAYGVAVFPENELVGDATPEEADLWAELTGGS